MAEITSPETTAPPPPAIEVSPGDSGGISFKRERGAETPDQAGSKPAQTGKKVPTTLDPATFRLALAVPGRMAASLTGYDGFELTDREIKDLSAVWAQVQIPLTPMSQALAATVVIVAVKTFGYMAWRRQGGESAVPPASEMEASEVEPPPDAIDLSAVRGIGEPTL